MVRVKEDTKFKIKFKLRRFKSGLKKRFYIMLILIFVVAVSAGIYGVFRAFIESDYFELRYVQVIGIHNLRPDQVIGKINLTQPVNIFEVDLNKLEKRLEKIGWVEDVTISSRLPDTLIVNLKERVPYSYLLFKEKYYLIDIHGVVITAAGEKRLNLPVLYINKLSYITRGRIVPSIWNSYVSLIEAMRSTKFYRKVSKVEIKNGNFVLFIGSLKVNVGKGNFPVKLRRLRKTLGYLRKRGLTIEDLQFLDKDDVIAKYTKE